MASTFSSKILKHFLKTDCEEYYQNSQIMWPYFLTQNNKWENSCPPEMRKFIFSGNAFSKIEHWVFSDRFWQSIQERWHVRWATQSPPMLWLWLQSCKDTHFCCAATVGPGPVFYHARPWKRLKEMCLLWDLLAFGDPWELQKAEVSEVPADFFLSHSLCWFLLDDRSGWKWLIEQAHNYFYKSWRFSYSTPCPDGGTRSRHWYILCWDTSYRLG